MKRISTNQNNNLTVDNASSVVFRNRVLSDGQTEKQVFQRWLSTFDFGLFITVEPTPYLPMKDDDIRQRIRTIDHRLNKELISCDYPKFKNQDRFWLIGFFEDGQKKCSHRHAHLLHYLPYHQMKIRGSKNFQKEMVKNKFRFLWDSTRYVDYLGKSRTVCPIHIEIAENNVAVSIYSSKNMIPDDTEYFFSY